ncbi:lipid ABC transporter permease [Cyanosarcina cf. burmensis CCALA 770]|nr:lipid ABC transporter permease [Cyanosarcina cf. burmensis CCALA 770]
MIQVFIFKLSLAWKTLFYKQKRFLAALFAISFAVFLMFLQQGFQNALLNSNVEFIQNLNTDLIIASRRRYVSYIEHTFKKNRLYQARGFKGVEAAYPLYITMGIWKSNQGIKERAIRVFAFNPADSVFLLPAVQESASELQLPDTLLADKKASKVYGLMEKGIVAELSGRSVRVIGMFELGTDFVAEGNLIISDQNFLRIFSEQPSGFEGTLRSSLNEVDLGLIKAEQGIDIDSLAKVLNQSLPPDVVVLSKQNFIQQEIKHWNQTTPVGFVFAVGTFIGFVVGIVVVYNIIYTDISENLPQYATLKAMGHSTSYLLSIVLLESTIISIFGFLPGLWLSVLIYELIAKTTGLLMQMTSNVITMVLSLTFIMCILAGLLSTKKLQNIDPAELYGQKI